MTVLGKSIVCTGNKGKGHTNASLRLIGAGIGALLPSAAGRKFIGELAKSRARSAIAASSDQPFRQIYLDQEGTKLRVDSFHRQVTGAPVFV